MLHPGAVGIVVGEDKMVVLWMVDTDVFEWWGIQIFVDGHEILGVAGCVHNVGLVDFISDFEEDA